MMATAKHNVTQFGATEQECGCTHNQTVNCRSWGIRVQRGKEIIVELLDYEESILR